MQNGVHNSTFCGWEMAQWFRVVAVLLQGSKSEPGIHIQACHGLVLLELGERVTVVC